ncbi:hypothetical protein ACFV3O_09655, partial [Streptomyces albidoflavus]
GAPGPWRVGGADTAPNRVSGVVAGQARPNSGYPASPGYVADPAVAEQGGRGGESAGPIVAAVLRSGA